MEKMKRKWLSLFIAAALVLQPGLVPSVTDRSSSVAYAASGDELVFEEHFDDAEMQDWITTATSYDDSEAYSGTHSLKYERTDPKEYEYPRYQINLETGSTYYATVMIKTKNVAGADKARIALEAYDGDDWKGGQYTEGIVAADWTLLKLPTYTIPEDATRTQVSLYLSKDGTGTVWFDDVKVYKKASGSSTITGYETSFEEDDEQDIWITSSTSFDDTVFRTGTRSLKYENGATNNSPRFEFAVTPGMGYYAEVWVKTEGISGEDGALLALDVVDSAGGWITGSYVNPIKPEQWTLLRIPLLTAPANATKADLTLYTRGSAGTVWFDDLQIYSVMPKLLQTQLAYPNYRGFIMPGDESPIRIKAEPAIGADLTAYTLRASLLGNDDSVLEAQEYTGVSSIEHTFASAQLAPGTYKARVEALSADTVVDSKEWTIQKVSSRAELPRTYVDSEGRFWRDDKLFLPIGIYADKIIASELEELKDSPINTLLPYDYPSEQQLDLAQQYGKSVIFSLKDFYYGSTWAPEGIESDEDAVEMISDFANRYKSHPALLAWYLNDESPNDDRLPSHYEAVKENDPDHPAYTVDFNLPNANTLDKTTDIFGLDVYPIKGLDTDPISEPGKLQKETTAMLGKKGQWAVVQAQNVGNYAQGGLRPPTEQEMRNMAWQYITEGARGILFYSLFDLKNDDSGQAYEKLLGHVNTVAQEIKDLQAFILSDKLDSNVKVIGDYSEHLHWISRQVNGKTYLAAVNSSKEELEAAFSIPAGMQVKDWKSGSSIAVSQNRLQQTYGPLEVRIYELSPLPTYPGGGLVIDPMPSTPIAELEEYLKGIEQKLAGAAPSEQAALIAAGTERIKALFEQISTLDLSSAVSIHAGAAAAELGGQTLQEQIANVQASIKRLNELLGKLNPSASALNAKLIMDLGSTEAGRLSLTLDEQLLQKLKEAGLLDVSAKWSGVTVSFDPEQFNGETELQITEVDLQETGYLEQALASLAYHIQLKINGIEQPVFQKPIRLELPVDGDFDQELLVMADLGQDGPGLIRGNMLSGSYAAFIGGASIFAILENKVAFDDIDHVSHWAGRAIGVIAANGIVNGKAEGRFDPDAPVTRAQFAAMLARLYQLNLKDFSQPFHDINETDWFSPYAAAAATSGLINGRANGTFGPNDAITRAEMAVLAGRAIRLFHQETDSHQAGNELSQYVDISGLTESMANDIALAVSEQIIAGVSSNKMQPNGTATRAQASVVIYRLLAVK
ncbi:putative S-layer protein [Paenibacillus agaridevorans]|uniref:Putative S-layer protein n=2 Tax=Paenibacillus agaridevorans TaxID=171404 RepID=A0A2R5EK94_9BACL|nr:putative S-layer protein [Paenibacillus agaridevorans]